MYDEELGLGFAAGPAKTRPLAENEESIRSAEVDDFVENMESAAQFFHS